MARPGPRPRPAGIRAHVTSDGTAAGTVVRLDGRAEPLRQVQAVVVRVDEHGARVHVRIGQATRPGRPALPPVHEEYPAGQIDVRAPLTIHPGPTPKD